MDKVAAIYLARKLTGLPGREIAAAFGVKAARVSNAVRAVEENADPALTRRLERLTSSLLARA